MPLTVCTTSVPDVAVDTGGGDAARASPWQPVPYAVCDAACAGSVAAANTPWLWFQ